MEDKDWFDVTSHVFIFFPFAVLCINTKLFEWSKHAVAFVLLFLVLVFSLAHHFDRQTRIFLVLDQAWVGIFMIFFIFVYIDRLLENKDKNKNKKQNSRFFYMLVFILIVFHAVGVVCDFNNTDDADVGDLDADDTCRLTTNITSPVIGSIGFVIFLFELFRSKLPTCCERLPSTSQFKTTHVLKALPYAVLAAIFFWLNDKNFYTHSLWHMYMFTAIGFGILFVTDLDDKNDKKESEKSEESNQSDSRRDLLNTMAYYWLWVVSLVFFAALYVYGAVDDVSVFVHWVWAAYAWGTGVVYFVIAVYIWKYKKEGELTAREMFIHGVLWSIAGFLFLVLKDNFWILATVLIADVAYTVWAHRNILIPKQPASIMPITNRGTGYTDVEIPQRYRKNTLRF